VKTLSEQGPQITIAFKTAEGIEPGKTRIMYKNLQVGLVSALRFSDDFSAVILSADIHKEAEAFLRRDSRFWVVKPRLGVRGVSGLSTLISGSFIEIEPGKGAAQRHFTGLEVPPVVKAEEAGKKIVLLSKKLGSIDIGSPIYYQGILAGEVLGYELGSDRKSVFVHAFVKAPYDKLIRGNTRFWNASGLDISIGSDGIDVRTESILSLLFGGIAFETPNTLEPVAEELEGLIFTLHDSYESIHEKSYTRKVRFVLFFAGSVRGLNIGAPVELSGIKVGSVVNLHLEYDRQDASFEIPVVIEIELERVVVRGDGEAPPPSETLQILVSHGLRARLGTGSLLTGQLFVELLMRPDMPARYSGEERRFPEIPTIPASLDEITGSLKGLLAKMEKLDIETIGEELAGTLRGANKLLNAPAAQGLTEELNASLMALRSTLEKLDRRVDPLAENAQQALMEARETLKLLNGVLDPDSETQFGINEMTGSLADMARSIRTLVDYLERNPQSLIFGR
jgi:paraquat-inducible protein B